MKKGNEGDTSALYVWNGISMFWGTSFHTDPHLHNTLQLVFDIEKRFKLRDDGMEWTEFSAAIIKDQPVSQQGRQLLTQWAQQTTAGGLAQAAKNALERA